MTEGKPKDAQPTAAQPPLAKAADGAAPTPGEVIGRRLDRLYATRDRTPWREDARVFWWHDK